MRLKNLPKLLFIAALGGVALQTNCIQASSAITAVATAVTAGGVLYIVRRIID
jgi:hypothetical protein